MKNVLVINSSLSHDKGNSNILSQKLLARLQASTAVNVVERNLAEMELPHLTMNEMLAWGSEVSSRSEEQVALNSLSELFIADLQQADTVVIGMPMYNFGVPSTFKAWIDRVARAGITFNYTETGPQGLLSNKKVYVLAARGGMYAGTPKDTQTEYLKDVLGFLGLTDIDFVYAEGLAMGPDAAATAWSNAEKSISSLIA
ncbi:FMN-dependent NADH-azoreductase [Flavobacterium sp. W21_SRS_FM6]|uniref:FMN-dependent NADH-azoreductase n=1 Tax=Flavobacterium sp. W21_SRS_FM6 TaxID=3240268 RepID=UPI003F8E3EB7